jgi:hypothetical protein
MNHMGEKMFRTLKKRPGGVGERTVFFPDGHDIPRILRIKGTPSQFGRKLLQNGERKYGDPVARAGGGGEKFTLGAGNVDDRLKAMIAALSGGLTVQRKTLAEQVERLVAQIGKLNGFPAGQPVVPAHHGDCFAVVEVFDGILVAGDRHDGNAEIQRAVLYVGQNAGGADLADREDDVGVAVLEIRDDLGKIEGADNGRDVYDQFTGMKVFEISAVC